jgi:hypothetical protein
MSSSKTLPRLKERRRKRAKKLSLNLKKGIGEDVGLVGVIWKVGKKGGRELK